MRVLKDLRQRMEAHAVRILSRTVPLLPRRCVRPMASVAGDLCRLFARDLRRVAEANCALAFPDLSRGERRRIVRGSFRNFARVGIDVFWVRRIDGRNFREFVDIENEELAREILAEGRGAIAVTPHLGNWEIISTVSALAGFPLHVVVHPLNNPYLSDWFDRHRGRGGVRVVHRQGAVRSAIRAVRRNEAVALLIDQNTKPAEGGTYVDFFGLPATITKTPAVLALRTGAPILFTLGIPRDDGGWTVRYGPRIEVSSNPDAEEAVRETTRNCVRAVEQSIRDHPDLWLWMYKRWKYRPSPDAQGYPYYATKVVTEP